MSRVLLYRAIGLGDFLTAVPAYRAVRRAFPEAEVLLAAPAPLRDLAVLTGAVDIFLSTPELALPRWTGPPPDIGVNLHGRGPQSHRLLQRLRPRRLVAFGCAEAGVAGPRWRADEHEVTRWCRLLAESGVPADESELRLERPGVRPVVTGATVVHPGAADAARRWPPERFARVAAGLAEAGHTVVLTGIGAERGLAEKVAADAGLADGAVLAGELDLTAMAALVAAARTVVCGDTGVGHLATAYGTRSVLLFGPMSPTLWGPPPGSSQHTVLWRPEAGPGRAALLAVTPDEVLGAVLS